MNLLKEKKLTVRKDHHCEWCNGPICAGNVAIYRTYILEGDFTYGYMHPECFDAMNRSNFEPGEGFMEGAQLRGTPFEE